MDPAPGDTFEGDFLITRAADVEALRTFSEVTGSLIVSSTEALDVTLPDLVSIGGDVNVDSTEIVRLALPNLKAIGGELWLYLNLALLEIDVRSLESLGTRVYVHRNVAVSSVQLFALAEIAGGPVRGFEFTAQLSLSSCFEDRLIELYPNINITAGQGPVCNDCALECDALVANCSP